MIFGPVVYGRAFVSSRYLSSSLSSAWPLLPETGGKRADNRKCRDVRQEFPLSGPASPVSDNRGR
ncbi:MAG: hypothetical protein JWL99_259 [Streptomyces oryziradicis]|jgi:hypothetical protein|nr:hypothetical protein [Actinacidiphila oryziradicis]